MTIIFEPDLSAQITVDEEGRPRHVRHLRYLPAAAVVPARAAADYLRTNADVLALPPEQLDHLHQPVSYLDPYDAPVAYRLADVKAFFDTSTVVYYQTVHNTPVWDGGLHVTVKQAPPRVVGAELRGHADLELELPDRAAIARVKEALVAVDAGRTAKSVSLRDVLPPASRSKDRQRGADAWVDRTTVTRGRFFVYRYVAADRVPDNAVPMAATSTVAAARQERRPLDVECHDVQLTLPLPPVPRSVADGRHYLVAEVVFRVRGIGADNLHWKALVEVGTGAVLWLRALTAGVSAMVFPYDPKTGTGDLTKTPDQADAVLNPLRQVKTLPNLNAPVMGVQSLIGSRVRLSDDTTPTIAPPTEGAAVDFDFDARTNDFAAANAYFHADNLFDVIESLGFALPTYFDGTTFPVHLDHRSHYYDPNGIEINAFCNGDGQSDGIGMVGYCLSDTTNTTQPLGRSVDKWVHWHELGGHGILWDHVNSANLGFSHSAGDSMAAFQNDPESQLRGLPQRFQYAPFRTWPVGSDRWFNRDVAAGWGWGGSQDQNGYLTEQILATTMFRIYQAIGGDAADVNKRWHASRVATYLILNAVGKLSPGANANSALDFYNT
ncbi:MAG: hypothetical protein JO079_04470, partial [Frankiaceae bacterium]|nr:hypothetical protein [Frankiaceae bacterium]